MTFHSWTRLVNGSDTVLTVSADRPLLARRFRLWHLVAFDSLVAVVFTVAHISFLGIDDSQPNYTGPPWFGVLISVVAAAPMAARRLWPLPVLALTTFGSVLATVLNAQREPWVPVACALYIVAVTNRKAVPALAGTLAAATIAMGLNMIFTPQPFWNGPVGPYVFIAVVLIAVWATGLAVHARRDYASRAVSDERLRIARELHDIMAHSMSLIAVKAGIANHVADERPEEARDALRIIEATSRSTLNDMRRMLGVLRSETGDLTPAPGVTSLPELVERARTAGVDVTLDVAADDLPEGLGMSVYRIVQESLTNVVKHAGPVRCRVSVVRDGDEVRIEVTDDGPGGTPGKGHGLIGMRERVSMYGGAFAAGPRSEGGFAVSARMPVER
jgi:signal transduction histidine kinase